MLFLVCTHLVAVIALGLAQWLGRAPSSVGMRRAAAPGADGRTPLVSFSPRPIPTRPAARAMLLAAWAVLALVAGLRSWDVGIDSLMYANQFDLDWANLTTRDLLAPGYTLLVLVFRSVSPYGWTFLFLVMAAATSYFAVRAVWEQSPLPWLGMLVLMSFGFLFEMVNQYRQMLALFMVLYAMKYLWAGRTGRFCAWAVIAALFHPLAWVCLAMPLAARIRVRGLGASVAVLVAAVGLAALLPLARPALRSLPYFGAYIGSEFDQGVSVSAAVVFAFRLLVLAALLVAVRRLDAMKSDPRTAPLLGVLFAGMLLQAAALSFHLAARLPVFYLSAFSVAVPLAACAFKVPRMRVQVVFATAAVFFALFCAQTSMKSYMKYRYSFVWEHTNDAYLAYLETGRGLNGYDPDGPDDGS